MSDSQADIRGLKRAVKVLAASVALLGLMVGYSMYRQGSGRLEVEELVVVDSEGKVVAQLNSQELVFRNSKGEVTSLFARDGISIWRDGGKPRFHVVTSENHTYMSLGDGENSRVTLETLQDDAWLTMSAPEKNDRQVSLGVEKEGSRMYLRNPKDTSSVWLQALDRGADASLSGEGKTLWKAP